MANLIMLIGISGCGKSTLVKKLNAYLVSSDDIRNEIYGDENDQSDPGRVFSIAHKRVLDKLKKGEDVVFDATNVTPFSRKSLLDQVKNIDCKTIGVLFLTTPDVAIERQKGRDRKVPEDVIFRQYRQLMKDIHGIQDEFDQIVCVP